MDTSQDKRGGNKESNGSELVKRVGNDSWTYIKTVVDIVHEPVLILDKDLRVRAANGAFYKIFQVDAESTEGKVIYELGNGQWDIPALRKLLEDILPKNSFFKGFEVVHEFPSIGRKVMILNAREIHFKEGVATEQFPSIILLAMEDVTEIMMVAETLANHSNHIEETLSERTKKMEARIDKLQKEVNELKNKKQ